MHLSDVRNLVSGLAVTTTILQFLSGTLVCKQYVKNQTTAESSPLPFLCGALSSALWLLYGLTKHDDKIVLVNTIGVSLMVSYTVVFYIYTFKKSSLLKQIFVTVSLIIFFIGYVSIEEDNELLLGRLGLIACSLTLITIAAPMSKLVYVIKMKNTECLPFPMIVMSFFVSALWFLYGLIEEDTYLILPNFIGAMLAACQLSLFLMYPRMPQSPSLTKSILA
ncbi:sugar transporter SWEET1 [Galleria mellonella]|uniref:Sugar transporter SWEET n=1 Tax=Galleria mellonella TaxID=7137 RepID=A0A6J1WRD4_GALME|nr:sugar transporter SWEET1 [Galleria mellonella]